MEKITEKLLLEKSSPKTSELNNITSINLSRMLLKNHDLPVSLLNKLTALEELDLSGNMLQKFPAKLFFPRLRILNLSNNDMGDVLSLGSLTALEELRMEDNLYLTVSDERKVMFLLPKLRMLNGKDISATANHIRYVNSENLKKRVIAVWEKNFSVCDLPSSDAVEKKFVNAACFQVKYGPSSLNNYTKWRVEMIAKEYLKSLSDPGLGEDQNTADTPNGTGPSTSKRISSNSTKDGNDESPRKRRTMNTEALEDASPRKSSRLTSSALDGANSRKSPRVQLTPQKSCPSSSSLRESSRRSTTENRKSVQENSPQKPAKATASPRKATQVAETSPAKKTKALKNNLATSLTEKTENGRAWKAAKYQVPQEPASLQPLHVLQCHSKQDSPVDFSTQLWACAFEPTQDNHSDWTRTVATCGGESVCVIDCESGYVLKKYKVPGEEFFSLAWTTLWMTRGSGSARPCTVLAAGGKKGLVKLIHPRANLAYGEFRASRRAIAILRFSPHHTSFLFSGSYDHKVIMWDIGGLDRDYNYKTSQLLILENKSTPLHLCFPPSTPDTHLLLGCDDGMYCFDIQLSQNVQKRAEEMEIVFPVYKKKDKTNSYRTIDGLNFLTDDLVASKSHMQGSIYLWSWKGTKAMCHGKKNEVAAVILAELQWSKTDIPYLSLNTCPGFGYVVCGDERGRLWTYHITDHIKAKFTSGKAIPATEVLEWPFPIQKDVGPIQGSSINSIAMDPELHYLVALSDKNMVVVWKRKAEPKS